MCGLDEACAGEGESGCGCGEGGWVLSMELRVNGC
jgi:hypothetical protein